MSGCAGISAARLAIAYGCVIGAAFASVLGALLVVLLPLNNDLFLASALAFAGGIMSYVSFVDIFANKAVSNFAEAGFSQATSYTLASVCFFAGFPISYVLDKLADRLVDRYVAARGRGSSGGGGGTDQPSDDSSSSSGKIHVCVQHANPCGTTTGGSVSTSGVECTSTGEGSAESCRSTHPSSCKLAARAPADLDSGMLTYAATKTTFTASTSSLNTRPSDTHYNASGTPASPTKGEPTMGLEAPCANSAKEQEQGTQPGTPAAAQVGLEAALDSAAAVAAVAAAEERSRALVHMGFLAALAVALHNCPEGLVTFVGYMDSVGTGITTAVAITLHNIPEGMVIASSVYYGTKSLPTALTWASIAALTEPLGGLIGLAVVCGGSMSNLVFGILFGLVAGIMVYISLKELLPGARRFDPKDKVATLMTVLGMVVMSASLTAIMYSQPGDSGTSTAEASSASVPLNMCTNATAAPSPSLVLIP